MRRLSCLAALVGLLSVGALGTAGPATAAGPPEFFGLVPQGAEPPDADIERMGEGNDGTVRLVVNWTVVEQTDDGFSFGALDAYVEDLAASGIRPFPVLFGTAPFVNSDPVRFPVDSAKHKEDLEAVRENGGASVRRGGDTRLLEFLGDHPGAKALPTTDAADLVEQNAPQVHHPEPRTRATPVARSHAIGSRVPTRTPRSSSWIRGCAPRRSSPPCPHPRARVRIARSSSDPCRSRSAARLA